MPIDEKLKFIPFGIAVLVVSDTRDETSDRSGKFLANAVTSSGHILKDKDFVKDEIIAITDKIKSWINNDDIQIIITTGGTGITGRDVTPEAVESLATKVIPGFGELFRSISYQKIGTSTIQSRAIAVLAETTYIFALPGSTGACKDAWNDILSTQLDSRYRPCNFLELFPRLKE